MLVLGALSSKDESEIQCLDWDTRVGSDIGFRLPQPKILACRFTPRTTAVV